LQPPDDREDFVYQRDWANVVGAWLWRAWIAVVIPP
jgi:hypothetical protein